MYRRTRDASLQRVNAISAVHLGLGGVDPRLLLYVPCLALRRPAPGAASGWHLGDALGRDTGAGPVPLGLGLELLAAFADLGGRRRLLAAGIAGPLRERHAD